VLLLYPPTTDAYYCSLLVRFLTVGVSVVLLLTHIAALLFSFLAHRRLPPPALGPGRTTRRP
jgi:hypothetical protein